MQGQLLMRLLRGVFGLVLLLATLVTVYVVASYVTVKVAQHNKKLRPALLKPFNKIILPIAGRRFSPYALLAHTGRRSGRAYATPVGAFPFGDGFVIGLSYGADVDWCRNVMVSGHAVLEWHGQQFTLERPELIPMSPAVLQAIPGYFRLPARELKQLVWLHQPTLLAEPVKPGNDAFYAS